MSSSSTPDANEIVTVTIPLDELLYPEEIARLDTYKDNCTKTFWLTRFISRKRQSHNASASASASTRPEPTEPTKKVRMSRSEYEAYWATDEEGRYIGTRPQGEGREILRKRL